MQDLQTQCQIQYVPSQARPKRAVPVDQESSGRRCGTARRKLAKAVKPIALKIWKKAQTHSSAWSDYFATTRDDSAGDSRTGVC